jgi:hypothetical protein
MLTGVTRPFHAPHALFTPRLVIALPAMTGPGRSRAADYWSRSPASQASTSRVNRRSRVSGRFASLIQKARILR